MAQRNTSLRIFADPGPTDSRDSGRVDLIRKTVQAMTHQVAHYDFGFSGDFEAWVTYATIDSPMWDKSPLRGSTFGGKFSSIGNGKFICQVVSAGIVEILDNIKSAIRDADKKARLEKFRLAVETDIHLTLLGMHEAKPGSAGFGVAKPLALTLATFTTSTMFWAVKPLQFVDFYLDDEGCLQLDAA